MQTSNFHQQFAYWADNNSPIIFLQYQFRNMPNCSQTSQQTMTISPSHLRSTDIKPVHLSQPRPLKYYSPPHSSFNYLLRIIHPPHTQNPQNPFLHSLSNYSDFTFPFTQPLHLKSQNHNSSKSTHGILIPNTHISPQPTPQILHNSVVVSVLPASNLPVIPVSITVTATNE